MPDRTRTRLNCWLRPGLSPQRSFPFRFAGRSLVADALVAPLAPFAIAESALRLPDPPRRLSGSGRYVCRRTGWIAGAWRSVEVWRHEQGLGLRLAGLGEFEVTAYGAAVVEFAPALRAETLAETLLGPPLVLALALQGAWCLHASAVAVDGRVVVFAGESGNGKSTLAASPNDAGAGHWRRLADDTLPVCLDPEGLAALPHFPQLKLHAAEQYAVGAPDRLPLAGICVVAAPSGAGTVSLRRLPRRQAMQALIRHTVAARLYDRPLLAAHLAFCAEAAERVPVWRLDYPHSRGVLPRVRDAIDRTLSLLAA